ncbi:MAG: helix-turn-helix transcriptional regulator [Firmicutes bacterium]|nr:helix-turn-helix transcriptional regulator [Bacillota bacterium]
MRSAREALGLTQRELAEKLSITPHHLGAIEKGYTNPGYDLFCQLVNVLNLQTDIIFRPDLVFIPPTIAAIVRRLHGCNDKEINTVDSLLQTFEEYRGQ